MKSQKVKKKKVKNNELRNMNPKYQNFLKIQQE